MTRREFETALCAKIEDIKAFYQKYNPEAFTEGDGYLTIGISKDHITCNNKYWEMGSPDYKKPVQFWKGKDSELYHNYTDNENPYMKNLD